MKELHALPRGGGYLDQPAGMMAEAQYLDGVFQTVRRWRTPGAKLQPAEQELIIRLTSEGYMGRTRKRRGRK